MKNKSMSFPIIFMTGLTAICVLLLAFINQATLEKVEENQSLELKRKILYVFNLYEEGVTSDDEVVKIFDEKVEISEDSKARKIYTLSENGNSEAYAVPFDGPGLWGSITGYIGVNSDLSEVTGIEFISQNETPGLGGRIAEAPYKEQFRGVNISNSSDQFIINRPAPGGNVDAVTGATQTSSFVQNMINDNLKSFLEEGGKQ